MLPDIDLRLQTLVKSLQEVVLPAIPSSEQFAREQLQLVVAHLGLVEGQWKVALKFELGSYDLLCELARALRPLVHDGALGAELGQALDAATNLDRTDYDAVSRAIGHIGPLLDRAISGDDTTEPMDARLRAAVLEYGARQAWRDRVWIAAAGVDPDAGALPGLESLFTREERHT